jgi:hypothetical protein
MKQARKIECLIFLETLIYQTVSFEVVKIQMWRREWEKNL